MRQDFLEIAKKLINFPSITPSHAGSLDYLEDILVANSFRVFKKEFGDSSYKVTNLYAEYGTEGPNLCFVGHVDVVPPGDLSAWQYDPFLATIDGDLLYGRGAADMKGAIAAAIASFINFIHDHKSHFSGKISFLLTSDEEGDGIYGVQAMIKWLQENNHKIDFAIIGEPTYHKNFGEIVKIGARGSANFILKVIGEQGHVAYSEYASSPVHLLIDIVDKLKAYGFDQGNKNFPATSLQVTSIDVGNNVTNIIPHSATARFNIRFNDEQTLEKLLFRIKDIIEKVTKNFTLEYNCPSLPFLSIQTAFTEKFVDIVKHITNLVPEVTSKGATSDGRFLSKFCSLVEFGMQTSLAHKINEHIKISDLQKLYSVYYMTAYEFLNVTKRM